MPFAVESHPQREMIEKALLAGESPKVIAKRINPYISGVSLWNYRQRVLMTAKRTVNAVAAIVSNSTPETCTLAAEDSPNGNQALMALTKAALTCNPYHARMEKHAQVIDRTLALAEEKQDARGVAALVGTDLKAIELDARLTGRLDSSPTTTIVLVQAPGADAPSGLETPGNATVDVDCIDLGPAK